MPIYKSPVQDYMFLLNDVFHIERHADIPGYADLTPDILEATLTEAARLSDEVLAPLNRIGDIEGCVRHEDGSVTTPSGFKEAYAKYREGGWGGLKFPEEYGGQGLPGVLAGVLTEFMAGANVSFSMYGGLTRGATAALLRHGSEDLKRVFAPKMIAAEWSGTMNLTEAHAGTDLGMLRSRAARRPDGSFAIDGAKIFISAGEHDLADNIIHLVLARIEGAPSGVKGISLFIVPKFLPAADGSVGPRNAVSCGSIEHKMGIHANSTCVMNFDGATGWLLGEENHGLNALFTMMNEARLGTGLHGIAIGEAAYQNAAAYAQERLQGRALTGKKSPDKPADPIIVHPDVRRMLLTVRATTEGARALAVWAGIQSDLATRAADPAVRDAAEESMALLTPVIKAFCTDNGFNGAVLAQQVYGGHGYIAENGMEQFVRDARINMIYEGTNTVQSLDLLGRKILSNNGATLKAFGKKIAEFVEEEGTSEAMQEFINPLADIGDKVTKLTTEIGMKAFQNPDEVGAAAVDYLRVVGHMVYAYFFARMAKVALEKKDSGDKFYSAKLSTARFYYAKLLPETASLIRTARAGLPSLMEMDEALF